MKLRRSRIFTKQYHTLPPKQQQQFDARLRLWLTDPGHPTLRAHPLKGKFQGYWSMNVSGDVRAIYYYESDDVVIFALIGTQRQLY